jgi:hypothetical protein
MSTSYYVTLGYGYHLTEDDILKLAQSIDPEELDEMGEESPEEFLENVGNYEVVDHWTYALKNFGTTSTWFYDYSAYVDGDAEGTGIVIYRKATTKWGESPGEILTFPKNTDYNQAELDEWQSLEKALGHPITFDAFVEVSIG